MKRPSLHIHTTHTRDAALLRLRRVNRWLIMGSVVLTAVLADAAANAFPGRTKSASGSANGAHKHKPKGGGPTGVLAAPEQAPEHTPEASGDDGSAASEGSSGEGSSSSEGTAGAEAPSSEARAPEETGSAPETSSEGQSSESSGEASEPVVSGGS